MLITEAMQTAVTPVFLLTGIGALLNVMMSRLGRIKDRERLIYSLVHMASGEDYILVNEAMKKLTKRSILVSVGIWLATGSALFVCLVIIFMFLGAVTFVESNILIASLFIICMTLLATSLLALVYEVYLATRTIHKNEASSEVVITKLRNL
ncbi:MAG: DUF2721 domain-containing protein [Gammaproteobacteria bacterium]|tara:strand:+ start:465 stop:920 length:456 start_codon:yes stop_codon:yes gene_type:complete